MQHKLPQSSPGFYSRRRLSMLMRALTCVRSVMDSRSNSSGRRRCRRRDLPAAVADREGARIPPSFAERKAVWIGAKLNRGGRSRAKLRRSARSQRVRGYSVYPEGVPFEPWVVSDTVIT
jgi:hypothetical protein